MSITACGFVGFPGVYKINVDQGNILTSEKVEQLEIGMSRRQVRFIMGTPLVEDSFNQDRWDYKRVVRNGTELLLDQGLTLHFDGDTLTSIEGGFLEEMAAEKEATELAAEAAAQNTELDETDSADAL
ncbi:UNVERIFIED_CONTAM: hypothetical protein GTU68_047295 [Idotea baltica]|nr:hypothetical protein [Idotea baltica]